MCQLSIVVDTPAFHAELKRSGNGKVPAFRSDHVAGLPANAYVLIGNRTSQMGGGLAGTGYVMHNGKALYSIPVASGDVHQGRLRLP